MVSHRIVVGEAGVRFPADWRREERRGDRRGRYISRTNRPTDMIFDMEVEETIISLYAKGGCDIISERGTTKITGVRLLWKHV